MKHKALTIMALLAAGMAGPTGVLHAQTYTSDPNIADQTAGISSYATFTDYDGGDVGAPFTPTSSQLAANGFRVYDGLLTSPSLPGSVSGANNYFLATFSSPVSSIRVFPNIDHYGSAYDGYQYSIYGYNGTTWTELYDTLTVTGAGEPFKIGTYTGTAPVTVNNVLTPGNGPGGTVGYEASFDFSSSYTEFAFGASTEAINSGNTDQELSAVGALVSSAPDGLTGGSCVWLIAGMGMLGLFSRVLPSARFGRAS